jgi:hypothetical protein
VLLPSVEGYEIQSIEVKMSQCFRIIALRRKIGKWSYRSGAYPEILLGLGVGVAHLKAIHHLFDFKNHVTKNYVISICVT